MVRTKSLKLWTTLGTILVAAMLATAGCDESEDDCIGAGCLTPLPDEVDVPCTKVCAHIMEPCAEQPLKLAIDDGPSTMDECLLFCEDGGFDADERACLAEIGCDEASACLDE